MQASDQREQWQERGAWARRHNRALVALARRVWQDDCTLQGAFTTICETAARTLDVERVNIWQYTPGSDELLCLHHYAVTTGHDPEGAGYRLRLGEGYAAAMGEVRAINIGGADAVTAAGDLSAYMRRHDIGSLLDAPIRLPGELLGVICHEHVGASRVWTPEDHAFAGSIGDYVAMAYEIDRRRKLEGRVRYLERHDPHTDLPNREHMLEVVRSALRPMHGDASGLVAIHLHVDAGPHEGDAGDELLARVAGRLRAELGDAAALARVRGDAFAVLPQHQLREAEALELAERCIGLIETGLAEQGVQTVVSAGIAFSRDLAAPSADNLLRNAELASHRARNGRYNHCEVFDAGHHRGLVERLKLERRLRDALAGDRLQVYYQPEVDLDDGHWYAAEALLRWVDEDGQVRPACEFIDIAESSGLILPMGRRVLAEACAAARDWPGGLLSAPRLRVNISARQFEQPGLVAEVAQVLADTGLPPGRLCLELTETALVPDLDLASRTLGRLRELGISIALDDFGVGFSSLAYLKRLPIDVLKLDRSFVAGLPNDPYDLAIVQAVAGLARSTGIDIVAEGVETEAQAATLRSFGITRAQGYLFARPCGLQELRARFAA